MSYIACQEEDLILPKKQILLLLKLRDIHHNLLSILDSLYTTNEGQVVLIKREDKEIIDLIHHLYHVCLKEYKIVLDDEAKHVYISIHYNFKHLFNIQMIYHPPGLGNRFVYRIKNHQMNDEDIQSWLEISDEKKLFEETLICPSSEEKKSKI